LIILLQIIKLEYLFFNNTNMKRLNRINFTILIITLNIIWIFLFILLGKIINDKLNILIIFISLLLIWLIIFWWILIIKRSHDFWARWGRHIIWSMFIPFYIFYVIFKKWDIWINKYWNEDNKIFFIKRSIKVNNESLLHISCEKWDIEEVKNIINKWWNINIQNNIWSTPLMKAIANNRLDIIELLLKEWADLKITRNDWYNALLIASYFWNINIVKLLLKYGADANFYNKGNVSALDIAQSKNHLDIISLLESKI